MLQVSRTLEVACSLLSAGLQCIDVLPPHSSDIGHASICSNQQEQNACHAGSDAWYIPYLCLRHSVSI